MMWGTQPCINRALKATSEGYTPNAVDFDGTNDYLTRGAALDGVSDSKLVSGGFWINTDVDDRQSRIIASATTVGGSATRFLAEIGTSEQFAITGRNSSGTVILFVNSSAGSILASSGWVNVLFSFDLSDTNKRHIYIADASDLAVTTYTNDTLNLAAGDYSVGATPGGANKINAQLSELWFAPGYYIDFSVEANRRQFITAAGAPAQSVADALTALSVTGAIILQGNAAGFGTNSGSGGDFTITGSLDDATPPP